MNLIEQQQLFTFDVSLLIQYAHGLGVKLTSGEAYRTRSQVLLNYFGYKVVNNKGKLSLVKRKRTSWTLKSKHPERMAIDFNFFINGKLTYDDPLIVNIGEYWESLSTQNEWGGNWIDQKTGKRKDTPHFQRNWF
ncbi:M15 family metallopeptidase [Aquimarina sp. AU119]|uniref:M15 family metallopeptidase n=1 Tax=Aquimarina sp. AU119 TaxID=2108528 RepID=UPI000D68A98F|nr:M15 family metallopeptidase [Aquimarina sp. AU119]